MTTAPFYRALRSVLPSDIDKNDAKAVLEFVTGCSYPTAKDPLLAVAHAAAQIISAIHDELHAVNEAHYEQRIANLEKRNAALVEALKSVAVEIEDSGCPWAHYLSLLRIGNALAAEEQAAKEK